MTEAESALEKFHTAAQVAEMFEVKGDTVRVWLNDGTLAGIKLPGGQWRISESEVRKLANNKYGEKA